MLADPFLAHVDVGGGTSTTEPYTLISLSPGASHRVNGTAAAGEPRVLKVSHSVVGKGASARNRHLVRMEAYGTEDDVELPTKVAAVYAVADIPVSGITSDQLTDLFQQFVGLLRGASGDAANAGDQTVFWNKWLNGEC